eukprot:scaffold9285_cov121-Isochrysis_galbana.AAC.1
MPEAVVEGLPSGAIGGAMAGTPPDRGAGARVTPHRPSYDHPGRLDQERHAGAAPSWPPGWHLRTVLARAPGSQPAPSSPSPPVACASPCLGLQELAAVDAPPAAPATRVPPAAAPAGAASSSRGLRLRPPPARDRSRGGVGHRSRATVFRVCDELEGKPK